MVTLNASRKHLLKDELQNPFLTFQKDDSSFNPKPFPSKKIWFEIILSAKNLESSLEKKKPKFSDKSPPRTNPPGIVPV